MKSIFVIIIFSTILTNCSLTKLNQEEQDLLILIGTENEFLNSLDLILGQNTVKYNCNEIYDKDLAISKANNVINTCSKWTKKAGGTSYYNMRSSSTWVLENYIAIKKNNLLSTYKYQSTNKDSLLEFASRSYRNQKPNTTGNIKNVCVEYYESNKHIENYLSKLEDDLGYNVKQGSFKTDCNSITQSGENTIIEISATSIRQNECELQYEFIEAKTRRIIKIDKEIVKFE